MAEGTLIERLTALSDDDAIGMVETYLKVRPLGERAELGGSELLGQCRAEFP